MITPKELLSYIAKYIEENQISPTVRELCELTGANSTETIHRHINRLIEFGYIEKLDKSPRSIKITDYGKEILGRG